MNKFFDNSDFSRYRHCKTLFVKGRLMPLAEDEASVYRQSEYARLREELFKLLPDGTDCRSAEPDAAFAAFERGLEEGEKAFRNVCFVAGAFCAYVDEVCVTDDGLCAYYTKTTPKITESAVAKAAYIAEVAKRSGHPLAAIRVAVCNRSYVRKGAIEPEKLFKINDVAPRTEEAKTVFANAIDDLETCDIIYDSFGNEYQYGRKRVYASAEALTINAEDGSTRVTFDPNDVVFYSLPQGTAIGANDKPFVQESTGELRVDAFDKGINKALDIYSKKIGLGENFYRFEGGSITTATQVISENSSTFRTVKKHEILIEEVLISLIKTILYAVNKFTPQTVNEDTDITVQFDDSIIEDKATERTRDAQEVRDGLMEPWEFRVKWYGMSEQDAKNWQAEHEAKQRSSSTLYDAYNMFGNGGKGEGVNT